MRGMAPTSTYSQEVADQIVDRLADGEFLRVICRSDGMPNWRTVYRWMDENKEFGARIAHARQQGFDAIAEDSLVMLDEEPERTGTQFGSKVDAGYVAWQKNRAEQRLKILAKWDPKRYGDKLALEHSGAVDLATEIRNARKRAG